MVPGRLVAVGFGHAVAWFYLQMVPEHIAVDTLAVTLVSPVVAEFVRRFWEVGWLYVVFDLEEVDVGGTVGFVDGVGAVVGFVGGLGMEVGK
eukprot:10924160-Ditylum_brightwellii.AAC.1